MSSSATEERITLKHRWEVQAIKLAMENQWEKAVKVNQDILEWFPKDVEARNRLGHSLTKLGRYPDALAAYRISLELDKSNLIARKSICRLTDRIANSNLEKRKKYDYTEIVRTYDAAAGTYEIQRGANESAPRNDHSPTRHGANNGGISNTADGTGSRPARALNLRNYQSNAVDALRAELRAGHKRIILCAPTGAGKTETAIHVIQEARAKGERVAFVADRVVLVAQTSQRLSQYGIPHGVAQGSNTRGGAEPVQVWSSQTIARRGRWPDLDLLLIDEAHTQHKTLLSLARRWDGPVIGLTATPLTPGLGKHYSTVVNVTTTDRLLADSYLAHLRVYAGKEIDMTGARKRAGEWQNVEVRTRSRPIIGDIIGEWERRTREHFSGPVKTLVFSADVAHGEEICRAFKAAGYNFRQSTYRDSGKKDEEMIEAFRRGDFSGLVSVEKFVKGFDVPDVQCIIGARPYSSSLAMVIQQMGRGMRTAPGKEYCLYLDHAGNVAGWYGDIRAFWADGVDELPGEEVRPRIRREGSERADVVCRCGFILPPVKRDCGACGRKRERRVKSPRRPDGVPFTTAPPGRKRERRVKAPRQAAGARKLSFVTVLAVATLLIVFQVPFAMAVLAMCCWWSQHC